MKIFNYCSIALLSISILSCSSAKSPEVTVAQMQELDALMKGKSINFEARWARPLVTTSLNSIANAGLLPPGSNINNIDLTGNTNYFRISGDSVSGYFPYYGEKQLGGGGYPPNNNAIQFDGVPEDFQIVKNAKGYQVTFDIQNQTETYQVKAQVFPSKKGNININSTHRFPIAYTGNFEEYMTTEE